MLKNYSFGSENQTKSDPSPPTNGDIKLSSFSQRNGQNVQGSSKRMFVPSLNKMSQNSDFPQEHRYINVQYYLIRPIHTKSRLYNILKNH